MCETGVGHYDALCVFELQVCMLLQGKLICQTQAQVCSGRTPVPVSYRCAVVGMWCVCLGFGVGFC